MVPVIELWFEFYCPVTHRWLIDPRHEVRAEGTSLRLEPFEFLETWDCRRTFRRHSKTREGQTLLRKAGCGSHVMFSSLATTLTFCDTVSAGNAILTSVAQFRLWFCVNFPKETLPPKLLSFPARSDHPSGDGASLSFTSSLSFASLLASELSPQTLSLCLENIVLVLNDASPWSLMMLRREISDQ